MAKDSAASVPVVTSPIVKGHMPGKLGGLIGTGPHAKISVAIIVIFAALVSGLLLCGAFFYGAAKGWAPNLRENVFAVWAIFGPMATGALGYIFGKETR